MNSAVRSSDYGSYVTFLFRLGNGEVTRDQACAVACVDPKTFDATLAVVESVLRPSRSSPRLYKTNITYRSLLKQFVAREDAFVPMVEVEEMLRGRGALVDGSPIDLESSLMQCAIFYWVCTVILKVEKKFFVFHWVCN